MKRIWAVIKKELKRFFTDYRMLLALVLPGIAIFIFYNVLGNILSSENLIQIDTTYQYHIALSNNYNDDKNQDDCSLLQLSLTSTLTAQKYPSPVFLEFDISQKDEYISKLKNMEVDTVIIFDDNFEKNVFDNVDYANRPNINVLYNSESKASEILFSYTKEIINVIYSKYTINNDYTNPNVGESSSMMKQIMGMVLPMVTMSLLYSITLTVCPESIAGEKERGTLSSILITPIKRSEFALGKIIALCIVSIFGGTISGAGMLMSLPKMMGAGGSININAGEYVLIFFVMLTLMLLFVNVATTVSTFAKTTKEASGYLAPLIAVFMFLALVPGFINASGIGYAFIPIVNTSQAINSIINNSLNVPYLIVTLLSNVFFSFLLILIDVKLFKTESVVMRQ